MLLQLVAIGKQTFIPIYSCSLNEIEPLSGFKWVDDWTVIVKDNVTDEEG